MHHTRSGGTLTAEKHKKIFEFLKFANRIVVRRQANLRRPGRGGGHARHRDAEI